MYPFWVVILCVHFLLSHLDVFPNHGSVPSFSEPPQSQVCKEWDHVPVLCRNGIMSLLAWGGKHICVPSLERSSLLPLSNLLILFLTECNSFLRQERALDQNPQSKWEWAEIFLILSWMAIFNLVICSMCLGPSTQITEPSPKFKRARRRSIFFLFYRSIV